MINPVLQSYYGDLLCCLATYKNVTFLFIALESQS